MKKSVSPPFQPTVVADDAFHFDTEYTSRYIALETINFGPINPSIKLFMKDITIMNYKNLFEYAYVNKHDQDSQRLSCRAGQRDDARTFPRFVLISTLMKTTTSRKILLPPRVDINYQGSLTWLLCSTRTQPRRRCHHPQDHLLLKSPLPSSTTPPTA